MNSFLGRYFNPLWDQPIAAGSQSWRHGISPYSVVAQCLFLYFIFFLMILSLLPLGGYKRNSIQIGVNLNLEFSFPNLRVSAVKSCML